MAMNCLVFSGIFISSILSMGLAIYKIMLLRV
jgi:hypothetical protein